MRTSLHEGDRLQTPGRGKPFEVQTIDDRGIVLLLGKGEWETRIPWEALEGIPELLRGRGWVRTSGSFAADSDVTTLSGYLQQFISRETTNWVAVVLERAGVLELDRSRPLTARLQSGY